MNPAAPMIEKAMEKPARTFCAVEVLCTRVPRCRSHLSAMNPRSKITTDVVPMPMNRSLYPLAPTSEI